MWTQRTNRPTTRVSRGEVAEDGRVHIEIGSFVTLAAMTSGELRVLEIAPDHLRMIRLIFAGTWPKPQLS